MSLTNKGSMYFEMMVSFLLLIVLIHYFVVSQVKLKETILKNRETYRMKQILYENLMLFEDGQELLVREEYFIMIDETKICIEWTDLNDNKQIYCEKHYKK